jgi:nicotinate-nucleotide adenylyltransferase
MRIGIYGGTFNPPHLGHLTAARAVFEMLKLDRLLLIPDGTPPHKSIPTGSPDPEQRLEMTKLAGEQLGLGDQVETLDLELHRGGRSYTSDTLEAIHALYPDAELWLLMGTDMFLTLQSWREPEKIFELAGIAAFGRTEEDVEDLFASQRNYLYHTYPNARIFTLSVPGVIDISSTTLRSRLAQGKGEHYLPPAVYGYILRRGLYGTNADLKRLTLSELRPVALSFLKNKRIPHVLGTEQEAIRLAERYGADVQKARTAALLHDCTKKLETEDQLALCRKYQVQLDELEQRALKLMHAKTGAAIARAEFGVDDEIYNAILWHTTGHAHMTLLEKIMYLADYIEPTRDFPGVDKLRKVCYDSLDAGLKLGLSMTVEEMRERGNPVHHATLEALEDLKGIDLT